MFRQRITAFEQQLRADGVVTRKHMQAIGQPEQRLVLFRDGEIENVVPLDDDPSNRLPGQVGRRIRRCALRQEQGEQQVVAFA